MTTPSIYSSEIYLRGMGGEVPPFTTVPTDLEAAARAKLDEKPFWYVAGSAGSGATAPGARLGAERAGDPLPDRRAVDRPPRCRAGGREGGSRTRHRHGPVDGVV